MKKGLQRVQLSNYDNLWYNRCMQNKKSLSERDIITKFIIPALEKASWNKHTQIREEVTFTNGRIFVKGQKTKRGEKKELIFFCIWSAPLKLDK